MLQLPLPGSYFNKFITMDFETFGANNGLGQQTVYACGFSSNGIDSHLYYLTNYPDSNSMIAQMFIDLCTPQFNNSIIYFHNFSDFDSMFILQGILDAGFDTPKIIDRDGSIIEMKISRTINKKTFRFTILDSYLILPNTLRQLCLDFHLDPAFSKSYFPYPFVTKDNLNYIGPVPASNFWLNTPSDFIPSSSSWSLQIECLHYLNNDIISLFLILTQFSHIVYDQCGLNITKIKTISSLAFHNYLANHYQPSFNICIIKGQPYKDIKQSYMGGLVDVYKPHLLNGF